MSEDERIGEILSRLDDEYTSEVKCSLNYSKDYELLFATILSAQCTDARVNIITDSLFKKYPSLQAFAKADIKELEEDVKPAGFYRNKAANIKAAAKILSDRGGDMPDNLEELVKLPGVGRKTANVVLSHIFNKPAIVVDTHVKRIAGRLGLTKETDPVKIEFDLQKKIPKKHWSALNTQLMALGRSICTARNPKCGECFLREVCPWER